MEEVLKNLKQIILEEQEDYECDELDTTANYEDDFDE